MSRPALAVIAKEPVAGLAKTRLAPALGGQGAARVAAALLMDTLATVRTVAADPWLCFAPAAARDRMAALAPGFRLLAQAGGDLGDRLAACAAALHSAGARRLGIVGADTPHLCAAWYRSAFALLDRVDLVLGPALDGGYYLVAMDTSTRPPPAELFAGVPMGSDAVLGETLARAQDLGLRVALLPPLRDLDRIEDLRAALDQGELARSPNSLEAIGALLLDGNLGLAGSVQGTRRLLAGVIAVATGAGWALESAVQRGPRYLTCLRREGNP